MEPDEDCDVVGQAELESRDERDIDHHGRDGGRDSCRRGTAKAPDVAAMAAVWAPADSPPSSAAYRAAILIR